jgi:exodeoxyribonuclease V gamma subunit
MIRLHYSNRLENLIAPLAEAVADHQRRDPLERISIVVPNRVVEQFVRHRLAESIGVAANLEFPFLRSYLARVLQSANKNLKILEADELQLVLFECLRSPSYRDEADLKPVRDYIDGGSKTDADVELRTLLLAAQLARLFREYSISRRRMIGKWRAARRSDLDAMSETERWQRHLWQLVFDSHGRVREEWLRIHETRLMLLPDAFEAVEARHLKASMPDTLHVFGASYAGNAYADIFAQLGALGDIRIYALNPCREFWEDVDTSRRNALAGWAHRNDKVGDQIAESEDPFSLSGLSDPPALRLWGRPGREYIRLLNEVSQCDFAPLFSDPVSNESEAPTVLVQLQQSILDREPERAQVENVKGNPPEPRITFLACPGIRREAEIVANQIWSLIRSNETLAADGKAERLRFHQIAVLLPDSAVDDYVAQIDSVFRKEHRIPLDLVSRSIAGASRVAEAVDLLLQLPSGRFSREEMIRLLTHPALNNESESRIDLEKWRRWSEALGIFFGADDDDLNDTYIPPGLYHWDQAIKRLALGTMMTAQHGGNPAYYAAGPNTPSYLPGGVAQDENETAARFMRVARSLIADALSIRSSRLTPREWSLMLSEFVSTYIRPDSAIDEQVRDRFLEAIGDVGESALKAGAISFESAREIVAARVTDLESRRGQYSERGVAIGSFSSLRSIPFKVIFALGLNDSIFPEREHSDPLDLRTLKRVAGDVSPAERDRYLFLETILAARERIFFSYIARNAKTGDALEPSPVIRELQNMLRAFVDEAALAKLTVKHPTSRYDLKYFPEFSTDASPSCENEFTSFDLDARRGARMLALRRKIEAGAPGRKMWNGDRLLDSLGAKSRERAEADLQFAKFEALSNTTTPDPREEIGLPIAAIRRYLECPLQGAARYSLGMLADEDASEEAEDEPIEQSILNRTVMLRNVFWRSGGRLDLLADEYNREVRLAQAHGRASAGRFAEAAKAADHSALRQWLEKASQAGVSDFDQWKDIRIGRADEFADAAEILPPITLDVDVRRHDGTVVAQRVNLYGTLRGVSPEAGVAIHCVLRKSVRPKDFLPLFLNAIVLAALGHELPNQFRAIVIGIESPKNADWIREFLTIEQNSARAYLTDVVADLLSTGNDYFLPIEAVAEVHKERRKHEDSRDLVEAVEQVLLNDSHKSSSEYGPVRNATSFDPPAEEAIERIFMRRFEPIAKIFK